MNDEKRLLIWRRRRGANISEKGMASALIFLSHQRLCHLSPRFVVLYACATHAHWRRLGSALVPTILRVPRACHSHLDLPGSHAISVSPYTPPLRRITLMGLMVGLVCPHSVHRFHLSRSPLSFRLISHSPQAFFWVAIKRHQQII